MQKQSTVFIGGRKSGRSYASKYEYFMREANRYKSLLADIETRLFNLERNTEGFDLLLPRNKAIVDQLTHLRRQKREIADKMSRALYNASHK